MAYVPPHLRNKNKSNANQSNQSTKSNKIQKDEFPELNPNTTPTNTTPTNTTPTNTTPMKKTMDFKKIFEKRREIRKRKKVMKPGWICLTKNGIIDSLTPEQRENNNIEYENRRMNILMERFAARIDKDVERRMEYEDLSPEELEYSSSSVSEESEEEELFVEDAEEIDERF